MSRNDDDDPQRAPRSHHAPDPRRAPYEAQRQVRTYGDDNDYAAEHPWRAAHPQDRPQSGRAPRWSEQPARYGGGYDDDEPWSRPPAARGDARYGLDTDAERAFAQGMQNPDNYHRAHGYGRQREQWRGQREERGGHGQDNSGYEAVRAYGQGNRHDDAFSDYARASWTQEHDNDGPPYGAGDSTDRRSRRSIHHDIGSQYAHTDTYGGAGFRQQGKRYWFDEGDQRSQFRGTRPRGYERSDERLRELACEKLTDADLDASDIEVTVSQGTVTLEGSVRARWMKHQAEDIVDDIGGVKDIDNHLRVKREDAGQGSTQAAGASGSPAPGSSVGTPSGAAPPGTGSPATGSSTTGSSTGASSQGGDIGGRKKH